MSAARVSRWSLIALVLAALIVSGCGSPSRRDFPNWRFSEPPLVSDQPPGGQEDMPDVAVNRFGQAVVVWSHATSGSATAEIYWRRYDSLGRAATPPVRITNNAHGDFTPRVAYVLGASYLVWTADEATGSNIWWAALDSSGNVTAGPAMISDAAQNDSEPRIYHCDESHVIWIGSTASMGDTIYYARIANNGTPTLAYRTVTMLTNDERDAVGAISGNCGLLHIAFVYETSPTNDDLVYTLVDTNSGMPNGTAALGVTADNENGPVIAVADDANGATQQVNIAWRHDDLAGGEIEYNSRDPDGGSCSGILPLTNDSSTDQSPAILSMSNGGAEYAYVAWERTGAGGNLDIYGKLFLDNCSPTLPAPTLVSDGAAAQSQPDRYVQLIGTRAPDGVPIFASVWRGGVSGRVFVRFGALASTLALVGSSEHISSAASDGLPLSPYRVTPELAVGGPSGANHLRVVWLGTDGSATDLYLQQTAWQTTSPLILNNHSGDAPADP